MEINGLKVIHFDKHNPLINYSISSTTLSVVDSIMDLGLIVDNKLSFKNHIITVRNKSLKLIDLCFKS